ncbi:MAG TPA: CoA transferase [Dehalococcoidia bacterium]|nr:CoA transferase [Dehalococcoidia bacterium]
MSFPDLLAGIRVLDLADESAVLASRLLADMGADVIRVEPPAGDSVRRRSPFVSRGPEPERSLYHQHFNRNKRGVTLDLETAEGREALRRLAASCDAVIETRGRAGMAALGLAYADLAALKPGIVYTTVTPFAQDGPFEGYRGNDLVGAASSGLLYLNGFPDAAPDVPGGEQAYKMASLVAAAATLMAILGRDADPEGRGRHVEVTLQEAASMATIQTANANIYAWHGRVPRRMGNISGIHRCKDGKWVSFVLRTGIQANWADMAGWLADEGIDTPVLGREWQDESYRIENRAAVTQAIARLCAMHDRAYIFHEGQRRKQLVMPVNTVEDLLGDEQLAARGYFTQIEHLELGTTLTDGSLPARFHGAPTRPGRRAPLLGEHNAEVLSALPPLATARLPAEASPATPFDPARPLAGIRVADFAWLIAGPASSRMLADFGAEVIKLESEYRVDNIRVVGVQPPGKSSIDTNGVFNDCNTNKLSVRLNMNHPKGVELAKEIIRRSDVVLNNFTAERMPRWGLGYEDLKAVKPDIVMLSMPVMGCHGPYRNYGSYGNGVIAFGGLNMITGSPERPPIGLGPLYSDFSAPYLVVASILAALYHRNRTGKGMFIDFSQVEATMSLLGPGFLEFASNGVLPPRQGNRSRDFAPHGVYPCFGEDRWCAIAVETEDEWKRLAGAIGRPEMAADPRFASLESRQEHADEIDDAISAWTRQRDPWQVMHTLQGRGIMAAVVEDLEDLVVRDPWFAKRGLVEVPFPEEDVSFKTHAQPARMNGEAPVLRRAPRMGEHTAEVLKSLLGLADGEIEALTIEQVLF